MSHSLSRKDYLIAAGAMATVATLPIGIGAQGLPQLKVGTGRIEPQAEAYYALDSGIFTKNGLNVDVQTFTNAGVTATAVAGGALQIGATTSLNVAQAHQRNLPFIVLAAGARQVPHQTNGGLVVGLSSPVQSAKDLNGKTIGLETVNGLAALTVKAMVDNAGGDSSTLQFVEAPSATMTDAVNSGRIDAAYLQDPAYTANRSRVRTLGNPNDAVGGPYISIVWFSTKDWLTNNKPVAKKFADSIYQAGAWAMANPTLAAASLDKHLGVKIPAATQRFATAMDINDFKRLFDLAAKYKFIKPVNPADIVWDGK